VAGFETETSSQDNCREGYGTDFEKAVEVILRKLIHMSRTKGS